MKTYNGMLLLFISLMKPLLAQEGKKSPPEWCWTRPNLDTKVKEGLFGINWGVCEGQVYKTRYVPPKDGDESSADGKGIYLTKDEEESAQPLMPLVKYTIKVIMGNTPVNLQTSGVQRVKGTLLHENKFRKTRGQRVYPNI